MAKEERGGNQVTSGRVVYSRTVQPAQYESERAEVELAFIVEDGRSVEDAVDAAMAAAKARVLASIGAGAKRAARAGGRFSRE